MDARGLRVTETAALASVPLPAIAHYRSGHFVVLERVRTGRSVRVVDPMRGRLELSMADFLEEFSGVVVALQRTAAFHPDRPYSDPRARLVNNDGRVFLRNTKEKYDLIIFALPDSLTLTSSIANLRLESFLFTQDSLNAGTFERLRRAFSLYKG